MAEAPEELKFMHEFVKKDQVKYKEVTDKVKEFAVIARRGSTVLSKKHSDITMFFDKFIIDKMENDGNKEPLHKSYILCFYFLKLLKMLNDEDIFETTKIENKDRSFTAHTFADTVSGFGVKEEKFEDYKEENYKMLKEKFEPIITITPMDIAFKNKEKGKTNEELILFMLDIIDDVISEKRKGFDKYDFPKVKYNIVKLKLELAPPAEKSTTSNPTKSTTSTPTTSTATNRVGDAAKGTSTALNIVSSLLGSGGSKKSRKRCNKSKRKNKNNKTRKSKPKRKSRKNSRS